jgi:DNA polymerase-4
VASDLQKPRGLSVLSPDDLPHKLYGLRLSDWPGIGRRMELRFHSYGVTTTEAMYRLTLAEMREIFGGIVGERWWRLIRGENVALPPTKRWQIGHSNVLAPEFRTPAGSWSVACRLLEKAATRMRAEGYHCGRLCAAVSAFDGEGWTLRQRFSPVNRTPFLLEQLGALWQQAETAGRRVHRPGHVSVSLQDVIPDDQVIGSLFEDEKSARLDRATDGINDRWGRGTVTVAAAMASKNYLDHGRIPFGRPTERR